VELLAPVKHDCPVCDQLLPALDAAGVRVVSPSDAAQTAAQAARAGAARVPELDRDLELSARYDPDAVPTHPRPAVLIASAAFVDAASEQAALLGQPALRRAFVAHPVQDRTDEALRELARGVAAEVFAALSAG